MHFVGVDCKCAILYTCYSSSQGIVQSQDLSKMPHECDDNPGNARTSCTSTAWQAVEQALKAKMASSKHSFHFTETALQSTARGTLHKPKASPYRLERTHSRWRSRPCTCSSLGRHHWRGTTSAKEPGEVATASGEDEERLPLR